MFRYDYYLVFKLSIKVGDRFWSDKSLLVRGSVDRHGISKTLWLDRQ